MRFQFGKLFNSKLFSMIFSIVLAIVSWLVVIRAIDSSSEKTIDGVVVDLASHQVEKLSPNNLNVVEQELETVSVRIAGDAIVVGSIQPGDIQVMPDLDNILEPGVKTVRLLGADAAGKGFEIKSIRPEKIKLRIDRMTSKKFPVSTEVEGLKIPEDYLGSQPVVTPGEITITGPDADVQRINKCVASVKLVDPLTKNTTVKSEIQLFDMDGNVLSSDLLTVSVPTADVTFQVNKQKRLPVRFEYLNIPKGFYADLDYTLSHGYIDVAGPEAMIDKYNDLNLGYVHINEIIKDKVFEFPVDLPKEFINVSDVHQISLEFDLEEMETTTFTIPGKNIVINNIPANWSASITTPSLSGVHMLGSPLALEGLSAQDLVAEVDLSEQEIAPGPYSLPVHISAPNKGLVWATGTYTVVVTIREQ